MLLSLQTNNQLQRCRYSRNSVNQASPLCSVVHLALEFGDTRLISFLLSHVSGNERADTAAKSALSLPIKNMKIPAEELLPGICKFCMNECQDIWDCCQGNKLRSLYPARELLPCVSNFCLAEWQDIWDCCEGNKLHSIYPTVGILKHSKNVPLQQSSNWSFSSHSLILIVWWWSSNLSVLRNSSHSKTYISGMYQLAGHSWKILHGVFCHRLV